MSKNFDVKINLRKLKSEVITTKEGTKCILIPISENNLFEGKEGGIYLDLTAWSLTEQKEQNGFINTHLVKQKLSKDVYENLSEEQRKALPIFGNVSKFVSKQNEHI